MTPPSRIVSLLASGTELICELGLGDRLVGRSHECDYPPWVVRLPVLSRPAFDATGTSREIDERVRARLRAGQPLYEVDEQRLAELSPDVVITQTHCEVCAVSPADLAHGADPGGFREQVVALSAGTLDGILAGFSGVARALGRPEQGEALVQRERARLARIASQTRDLVPRTVVCLEWVDPPFAMGNWGPELVALAGGTCMLGTPGAHSTTTPWDDVTRADPEVLVVAPCGYGLERALSEIPLLERLPGFAALRAVRAGQVFVADGNRFFNRSGPSAFETAEILAEILHPEIFAPVHRGSAWVALQP